MPDSDEEVSSLAKLSHTKSTTLETTPSVPLTRAKVNMSKGVVAGHKIGLNGKGKGKKKVSAAIFIDDEAEDDDGNESEADKEEFTEEEKDEEKEDAGANEDLVEFEENDAIFTDVNEIPVGGSVGPLRALEAVRGPMVKKEQDPDDIPLALPKKMSSGKLSGANKSLSRGDKLTPAIEGEEHIVYHEDLLPSVIDYTKTEVILTALDRALDLWSDKEEELCGVCENEVHPGVDAELKKTPVEAINLPDPEYSITGDVEAFAHIEWSTFLGQESLDAGIWSKVIKSNIVGHNMISLSWNPPTLFQWVASKNPKFKRKLHLCFRGTDTLAAGLMFGQVISSSLKNKATDGNFIKLKIRSSISIVTIQTEWEHATSMLSLVTGNIKLVFPTFSQGVVFGTIALGMVSVSP
ncbi:hypothetical protein K439DRAFT_1621900 [Ramaria rubella]|nr:hypothetical protein K439DRAFT_1621900 [Ramaria rubella]